MIIEWRDRYPITIMTLCLDRSKPFSACKSRIVMLRHHVCKLRSAHAMWGGLQLATITWNATTYVRSVACFPRWFSAPTHTTSPQSPVAARALTSLTSTTYAVNDRAGALVSRCPMGTTGPYHNILMVHLLQRIDESSIFELPQLQFPHENIGSTNAQFRTSFTLWHG